MVELHDRERTYRLVRVALAESLADEFAANAEDLDSALTSLDGIDANGNTDHDQLRSEIKARFATSIDRKVNADGKVTFEEYVNEASEAAIDQGYAETVLTRTYPKIVGATATLGTAPDMSFDYTLEGEEEPEPTPDGEREQTVGEQVGELVGGYRDAGRFKQALIRADRLSVGLGSSAMYIRWHEGGPKYQAVPPQSIYARYGEKIVSDDGERSTDNTDIDDATCVGVRLPDYRADSTSQPKIRFLTYCGRSDEYPKGRCVVYTVNSLDQWADVPPENNGRVLEEYRLPNTNEIANPLTLAQDEHKTQTEYPVAIFLGQDASADLGLFPTSGLALWRDTTEFDIAYSRVLSAAVEGARGLMVVKNDDGAPLPRSMTGAVAGRDGLEVSKVGHEAAGASKSALEVLEAVSNRISNAYFVPAYQMTHDGTKAPQSGYSLDVQNMPLEQRRRERIELNEHALERVFWIERGLHLAHGGQGDIPEGVTQQWNPGNIAKPVDRAEQIANLGAATDKKYIDYVRAVREYNGFSTDAQAIDWIEEMGERPPELSGPSTPQATGLRAINAPPPRPPRGQQPQPETAEEGTE
jgi:hypothetical protein